jgi:hypothetical protein
METGGRKNMIKFPLLTADDIEVKVKQCTKSGVLLLLYKTARTDARILDETVGPMNWECQYADIKGNLYCGVGIREKEDQEFVWKWDCGIESDQDDGQEKKAEASDAFKRACSRLGIGRELYTSPKIWADIATVQKGDKYFLEDKFASYYVSKIEYNEKSRSIIGLEIRNVKTGTVVYTLEPTRKTLSAASDLDFDDKKEVSKPKKSEPKKEKEEAREVQNESVEKEDLKTLVRQIGNMVKSLTEKEGSPAKYKEIVKQVTGDTKFKCNVATEDDYDTVLAIRDELVASGLNA